MNGPMSEGRLADIGNALTVADGPTIAHELYDEVQRLRALEESYIVALDQANIGDMQRLNQRAEAAERALVELRERIGGELLAPGLPDPEDPTYRRFATAWHTVSLDGGMNWTETGYDPVTWTDTECPEECQSAGIDECPFDRVSMLLGLYHDDLTAAPRQARAHINGPDANSKFEVFIEWGDVAGEPKAPETGIHSCRNCDGVHPGSCATREAPDGD